jgi:glycerol-3-phosphate dehydrogenase
VQRDLRRLADRRFDLIVVGAGFYGAIAAWDATLRGLAVALIDKGDFGGATSFNNLKTLHGGLRSLQSLDLRQMRLFIRERRALARIAPHLVQPLPFVVPTYRHPGRSRLAMRLALALNDAISHDRHDGVSDPALQLPGGRIISRAECLQLNPVIDPVGVTGGAMWHDYQMHNTDRMTLSFVLSAADAGAVAVNYAQADALLSDGHKVDGVRVRDVLSGDTFDVRADAVLNATGPWAASFLDSLGARRNTPATRLSRAMNLVVRRVDVAQGCGGRTRGRFLFMAPWRNVTLVGTSHDAVDGGPDALTVSPSDVEGFLADVRAAFPHADLAASDVRLVHRGLLPMVSGHAHHVKLLRESRVVDHARHGVHGLVSMFGVRYTTARATAECAIDVVFRQRGVRTAPPCRTTTTAVAGGAITDKERFVRAVTSRCTQGVSREMLSRLALSYGTAYDTVLQPVREDASLASPLGAECAVTGAEILHAVRNESAVRLSDALIRRTEAGSAGHPGRDAVERAAAIVARERRWDEWRIRDEIADVEAFYALPS